MSPTTVMQQVGTPTGTLTLMYTGVPPVSDESQDEVTGALRAFSRDCQMMTTWFVGIMASRSAMREHLERLADQGVPLRIATLRPDGRDAAVLAETPATEVIESIADAGEFERLYANSFVVFAYHLWEETIRPKIADAIGVDRSDVRADLMGEWRLLRNWIVHPSKEAEDNFFRNAESLPGALGIARGDLSLTANSVIHLVLLLNNMRIEINPHSLEMGFDLVAVDPEMIAELARTIEPGAGAVVPATATMAPSPAMIVFDEAVAMIHEDDCSPKEAQLQSPTEWRQLMVPDRRVASSVIECLGLEEQFCQVCRPR